MDLFDTEDCDDSSAMTHVVERPTDRRALLTGAGRLAASALIAPSAFTAAGGDPELHRLGLLLDAAWSEEVALGAAGDDIEEAYQRTRSIAHQIERIAATTLAGLFVKARACSWCHSGEPFDPDFFSEHPTTDSRLAASVLRDLIAISGKPVPQAAA